MPLQITESWGFPCPGPGEGLALKVALAAELQSCLWLTNQGDKPRPEAPGYMGNPEAEPGQDSRMPVAEAGGMAAQGCSGQVWQDM